MLVSEFILNLNDALRGTDDDPPLSGSDEYAYWVRMLNRRKDALYRDTTKRWQSAYDVRSLGTVTALAAPVFNTDASFLEPSDKVYVITTSGQRIEYEIVKPEETNQYRRQAYIAGMNPQKLYLTDAIAASDLIVGGTLYLPGYYLPADVEDADDVVPLPDPFWGVLAVATEIAANDIVYEDKTADLNAKANELYDYMVRANQQGTYANTSTSPVNVPRVGQRAKR